jgi:glycine betaine/proline transport system substrate-binding protein
MRHFTTRWTGLKGFLATLLTLSLWSAGSQAADLPGKGVTVQPLQSSIAEETFQTLLGSVDIL